MAAADCSPDLLFTTSSLPKEVSPWLATAPDSLKIYGNVLSASALSSIILFIHVENG